MNYGTKVYISTSNNPFVNLAIEDWIFEQISADQQILYLWCNRESVIIGRFQNPWMECNLRAMERDGVLLARRQRGRCCIP
jgi:lipoate-protein ligase A